MSPKSPSKNKVYQIKVTLRGSKPPIWRRLLVPGETSLYDLHKIIQIAMGWTNSHLHQFVIDGEYYSIPSNYGWEPTMDEREYRLADVALAEKRRFIYEYDFGDSWEHQIIVEKILPADPNTQYPRCLKGKRACPPEDVGGVWGFAGFLEALRDPTHEEHEMYREWWGEKFDSENFNLEGVNEMLQNINETRWLDEFY
ncbi:MAG: plasmid pRiA4b ORF-3 family protein [Chloroflexi bacterium]|nr:plasmid pRiA4b ORF-3 family protein [Chloroflexota bacterium]